VEIALAAGARRNSTRGRVQLPDAPAVRRSDETRAVVGNAHVGDLDEGEPEVAREGRAVIDGLVEADEGADVEDVGIVGIRLQALDGDVGEGRAAGHALPV